MALLSVENLKTYFDTTKGDVKAVDNVNFSLEKSDALGIAGESGCGKTTTALSLMRLLPSNGKIIDGSVMLDGMDLVRMREEELRKNIRWKRISIVFQGAMNALNPVHKVGDQIVESIITHEPVTREEAFDSSLKLLELVGINPDRASHYPFEFSGGMRQRVMIAMALSCSPDIVIADEPTTALDVIVQAQILKLLNDLQKRLGLSLIVISHDLSVIAEICNKVAIMYAGKIVEYSDAVSLFKEPLHPYVQGLMGSFPNIRGPKRELQSIPGAPPDLINPPPACRFHPRCPYMWGLCREVEPKLLEHRPNHFAACHLYTEKRG